MRRRPPKPGRLVDLRRQSPLTAACAATILPPGPPPGPTRPGPAGPCAGRPFAGCSRPQRTRRGAALAAAALTHWRPRPPALRSALPCAPADGQSRLRPDPGVLYCSTPGSRPDARGRGAYMLAPRGSDPAAPGPAACADSAVADTWRRALSPSGWSRTSLTGLLNTSESERRGGGRAGPGGRSGGRGGRNPSGGGGLRGDRLRPANSALVHALAECANAPVDPVASPWKLGATARVGVPASDAGKGPGAYATQPRLCLRAGRVVRVRVHAARRPPRAGLETRATGGIAQGSGPLENSSERVRVILRAIDSAPPRRDRRRAVLTHLRRRRLQTRIL